MKSRIVYEFLPNRGTQSDGGSGSLTERCFSLHNDCLVLFVCLTANNFGTDSSGKTCVGCGSVQEEFYGCSDIAIGTSGTTALPHATHTLPTSRPAALAQSTPVVVTSAPPITATPAVVTYPPFRPITKQTLATVKTYPPFQPITPPTSHAPAQTYPPFQPLTHPTPMVQSATSATQLPAKTFPPFQPIT